VLLGITQSMMPELERLITRPGVIGISNTNQTAKTGRWNVLVTKAAFKSLRKTLTAKILDWVSALPDTILDEIPSEYPLPQVYQKNGYEGDGDSSSGQASYMSSCAQRYGSFDDTIATDEEYFTPPGRSYASALTGHTGPPVANPQLLTEVLIPSKATQQESQAILASVQSDVKIANLEAEVKSLRLVLLGATTPLTVTEVLVPKSSATEEQM
jgi:hypothetical protein